MPKEVDPKDTTRTAAYALWMKAPNQWSLFSRPLMSQIGKAEEIPPPFCLFMDMFFNRFHDFHLQDRHKG